MKERLLAILRRLPRPRLPSLAGLGYAAFFVVAFVLAAYWTFPWDRVRDYVVQEVERPAGPGGVRRASGWELDIGALRPSWLTGVVARDVRIAKRPEDPEAPPMEARADELRARVSLLSLLGGGVGGSFGAELAGGSIEGSFDQDDEGRSLDVALEGVQLRRVGILRAFLPIPVAGELGGEIDLRLAAEPEGSEGSVDLAISGLTAGDGQAKLPIPGMGDGITLERIDAGTLVLRAEVEEGVADLTTLRADGEDLELTGDGTVRLLDPLTRSRVDLLLRVRFTDAYRNRNDRTRAIFSIVDIAPQARRARAPDGALQFQFSGLLGARLRSTPAGGQPPPATGGG